MGLSEPFGLVIIFLRVEVGSLSGGGPNESPCLQEVGAPTWGPVKDLAPLVESMLPKGSQFLEKERQLRELLGVQGHPSSSVWTGIREDRLVEIWFPDHISGPPKG